MIINKWVVALLIPYILFSIFLIYSSSSSFSMHDSVRLFYKDPNAKERVVAAIASDHDMVLIARIFHNKLLVSWQVFCNSIYRSVDIPFIFSLTERSALYDNPGKMQMLPPYELPFFLVAVIYFIKRWDKMRRYGLFLLGLFIVSLVSAGLLWPFIFPTKLILLLITIQLLIFFGCVGIIQEIWQKK